MENDIVRMLFLRRQRQKKRWKIKTISGAPPLSFKAKAGALKDYRIYGQTSRNLFDGEYLQGYWAIADGSIVHTITWICTTHKIKCKPSTNYTVSFDTISRWYGFIWYDSNGDYISSSLSQESTVQTLPIQLTMTSPPNAAYFGVDIAGYPTNTSSITADDVTDLMVVEGSTALPYEPYGESVGDRTGNLFEAELVNYNVNANGKIDTLTDFILSIAPVIAETTYTISNNQSTNAYAFYQQYPKPGSYSYNSSRYVFNENSITIVAPIDGYIVVRKNASDPPIMLNEGATPLPYEPYGYKVPVTVSNGTDTLTTPIYLPEQIKKVGDETEYIDYGEQKQHRVRKNLLPNNAVSRTMNGITVTVNEDGSIVCDGTATSTTDIRINNGFLLSAGNYRLTGCPSGGGGTSYYLRAWYSSESVVWLTDNGEGFNFTLIDTTTMRSSIIINNSQVVEHLTFYPMIRKADIEDDTYEPYIENTDLDVTLPELPTLEGTNVLTVGTAVQPSDVYIKGRIKKGE